MSAGNDSNDSLRSIPYISEEERMQIPQVNQDNAEKSNFRPFVTQNENLALMQRQDEPDLLEYPCHVLNFRKVDIKNPAKFWIHILDATREQSNDNKANQATYIGCNT